MSKPSDWHWVKDSYFVCLVHGCILYERLHCSDAKTWRHAGPFTGAGCETAGPFETRELAQRWIDKHEVYEYLEETA